MPFDCELIRQGWPAQPVNSLSSLAFLAVAAFVWRRGRPVQAGFLAGVAVGSAWFHSAPSGAASWAHDVTLYALVAVAAIELWELLAAGSRPLLAGGIFAVGAAVWFFSRTGGYLCRPESLVQGHAIWHTLAAVAAGLLFAFGPDRPRENAALSA